MSILQDVPIVGQQATVYEATVVVPVRCNCQEGNAPFLITNIDQAKVCKLCGKVWALTQVAYNRKTGGGVIATISLIGARPSEGPSES